MTQYRFDGFVLDEARRELLGHDGAVALEPRAFDTLVLLIENRNRVVSKDELIGEVWGGRIVSDAALASQIKAVRRAVGDDGKAQRVIKTVHGHGFRFVAALEVEVPQQPATAAPKAPETAAPVAPPPPRRPSIAVLPFQVIGDPDDHTALADAFAHDLIVELSRLRYIFVIARASSFQLRDADPQSGDVSRRLGARYGVSGSLERMGSRVSVVWQLWDTADGRVVWAERWQAPLDRVHELRADTTAKIVAALSLRISANAAERARLTPPENLDAWERYHLGLHHLFRFNRAGIDQGWALFQEAIAQDPGFARAHAGLSLAQFMRGFLGYADNPEAQRDATRRSAERSLELDPLDPFAHFVFGRSMFLYGDLDGGKVWLDRAVELSPNYAKAIYSRGWFDAVSGNCAASLARVDEAMALSPLDPFSYAFIGTRALAHMGDGNYPEAILWAERAARAPGAHEMISLIAAACHALNDDLTASHRWIEIARTRNPALTQAQFYKSFPFRDEKMRQLISIGLARAGLP
ncbi:MAG: winged helix-turn-helix domain-containing protein [Pseudomonadota bacterium]